MVSPSTRGIHSMKEEQPQLPAKLPCCHHCFHTEATTDNGGAIHECMPNGASNYPLRRGWGMPVLGGRGRLKLGDRAEAWAPIGLKMRPGKIRQ